jgi:superfamily II DNA or RNA helicase/HKD family nuclease
MGDDALVPGLRDELITAELADLLQSVDDGRILAEDVPASVALERLGRHLLRVARRMRSPSDGDDVRDAASLVNAAIGALGDMFSGDKVEDSPRVLKGLRPEFAGLSDGALPDHPVIPLTASELLVNGSGEPALGNVLKQELRCASDVDLVCAFVGFTGFEPLRDELRTLVERGGRVRVITSTYLGATSGKALDEFVKLGADVRVNYNGNATKLHAKAWLFRRPRELDTAFVGSSNLSEAALYSGLEWNVRLARADAPGVFQRIQNTFESYWQSSAFETYTLEDRDRLDDALLRAKGHAADGLSKRAVKAMSELQAQLDAAYAELSLQPKDYQKRMLDKLHVRRAEFDEHRHLIVAATGTGKTVMAALDYARMCASGEPRPSLLFVAHREQILQQARATFRKALRDPGFGEVVGGSMGSIASDRHVFAMVQTLHNRLAQVPADAYDFIYIDEAHHGAASTWREVIEHFSPREIVGMTATPERADGVSIAELFGGEYTAELRLWEAVDDQVLAPFTYVGVDDGTDLRQLSWNTGDYAVGDLESLYTGHHERVKRIIDSIHRWVELPAGMRALGFCVSVKHAQFMTDQFNSRGFRAEHLSGEHSHEERDAALGRLKAGATQVVFSVDVLGEGIDVPDVDTLLLLRPTQSPVLFAQQLGRGLRTAPGKAGCLVLDFIGQHRVEYRLEERFMTMLNPGHGTTREQAEQDFPYLPAGCAINLERVARERVLAALKAVAVKPGLTGLTKDLAATRAGSLEEFLHRTGRSVEQFYGVDGRKMSWTRLLRTAGMPTAPAGPTGPVLADAEAALLRRVGYLQHAADRQRVETWFDWMTNSDAPDPSVMSVLEQRLAMQLMHLMLMKPATLEDGFTTLWAMPAVREEIAELLTLERQQLDAVPQALEGMDDVPLMAHARYTRAEVFAAIGISTLVKPKEHREGVYYSPDHRTQLMFVTLNKDSKQYAPSIQYRDFALAPDLFHWESPNSWRQDSPATLRCIGAGDGASRRRLLFVREGRTGAVASTFRCFGQVDLSGDLVGDRPVAMTWKLRQPLPELAFESVRLLAAG